MLAIPIFLLLVYSGFINSLDIMSTLRESSSLYASMAALSS